MTKRSGCQRWWESCKGWENFVKAAEEFCKRALKREENNGMQEWNRNDGQEGKGEQEKERKKNIMKERNKLRNWDPSWRNQIRVQIMGDSNLVVNWMHGRSKINNQKFRAEVQETQNVLDKTDIRPMAGHLDLFQHIYRDWNGETERVDFVFFRCSSRGCVQVCVQSGKKAPIFVKTDDADFIEIGSPAQSASV